VNWWQRVCNRDRLERELDAELRYHFDRQVQDNLRMGMAADEARRLARLDLGGDDQLKESCRDARGTRWVGDVGHDVRFVIRRLFKDRWFTLAAVVTLAIGIGMNGSMFAIVNAMIRGFPIDRPDRIFAIHTRDAAGRWRGLGVSHLDFRDFQVGSTTFAGVAAFSQSSVTLGDDLRAPERAPACYVSANAFQLLGVKPAKGRDFTSEDDRPGAPAVVLLGSRVWTARYNADAAIVGRRIRVDSELATVIGVMPDGFRFPVASDVWQPLARLPGLANQTRDARQLQVFGRLADQSTVDQAQAEVGSIAARLAREYPATNDKTGAVMAPFPPHFAPDGILLALMTAVACVLIVACINVANLVLARSVSRSHELSIRASLGATRWRIVRQMLVENGFIVLAAGTLGWGLTHGGLWLFANAVAGITFPYYVTWTVDGRVLAFAAATWMTAVFIAGLLPAIQTSRLTAIGSLHQQGKTAASNVSRRRWTSALLAVEMAMTLILLAAAGLMMRSFLAVYRADSIVDAARVVAMPLSLPGEKYRTSADRTAAYRLLEERIDSIADVSSSAFANVVPFVGGPLRQLAIEGRPALPGEPLPFVSYVTIRGRYFDALGLKLLRGRTFTDADDTSGSANAIVNLRLASKFFPGEDPIGRRICLSVPNSSNPSPPDCMTIVGVSPTVRQQYFQDIDPVVFVPNRASSSDVMLIVRSSATGAQVAPLIRAELFALDPDISLNAIMPLERAMTQSRWGHRVFGGTLTVFAIVAMVLAAVGLYAVMAFSVVQRTQEIGIRMALGAASGSVAWLFVKRASLPVVLGISGGLAGAVAIGRLLQSVLIQTAATDPATLAGIAALVAAVSLAACFIPARRASRLDPLTALRSE
jgi:putative ABC transport system permease protein